MVLIILHFLHILQSHQLLYKKDNNQSNQEESEWSEYEYQKNENKTKYNLI